jgi:hypothetical protein
MGDGGLVSVNAPFPAALTVHVLTFDQTVFVSLRAVVRWTV